MAGFGPVGDKPVAGVPLGALPTSPFPVGVQVFGLPPPAPRRLPPDFVALTPLPITAAALIPALKVSKLASYGFINGNPNGVASSKLVAYGFLGGSPTSLSVSKLVAYAWIEPLPYNQINWPNPLIPRRLRDGDVWASNPANIPPPPAPPPPPISQNDWPNPLRARQDYSGFVAYSAFTVPVVFQPVQPNDFPNPLRARGRQHFVSPANPATIIVPPLPPGHGGNGNGGGGNGNGHGNGGGKGGGKNKDKASPFMGWLDDYQFGLGSPLGLIASARPGPVIPFVVDNPLLPRRSSHLDFIGCSRFPPTPYPYSFDDGFTYAIY